MTIRASEQQGVWRAQLSAMVSAMAGAEIEIQATHELRAALHQAQMELSELSSSGGLTGAALARAKAELKAEVESHQISKTTGAKRAATLEAELVAVRAEAEESKKALAAALVEISMRLTADQATQVTIERDQLQNDVLILQLKVSEDADTIEALNKRVEALCGAARARAHAHAHAHAHGCSANESRPCAGSHVHVHVHMHMHMHMHMGAQQTSRGLVRVRTCTPSPSPRSPSPSPSP